MNGSGIWLLDFRTGESREMTLEEHRQRAAEWMARTKVKDGVVYVDCDPPADPPAAA